NAAPFMIGDNTGGGCGGLFINGALAVSITHPTYGCSRLNIAENNSPIPQNRVYASYRHFHNASLVSIFPHEPTGGSNRLDINRVTLGWEKLITDRTSVEIRVPFNQQLDSDLSFSQFTGQAPSLPLYDTTTELGNVSVVLKSLMFQNRCWSVSAGLALN